MNPILAQLWRTGQVELPDGSCVPLHSHLPQTECAVLQAWIGAYRPRRLLEIGLAYGVSALSICAAVAELEGTDYRMVDYQIVDPHQHTQWQSLGVHNLKRAGYNGRFTLHAEPSELCLPRLLQQQTSFDFALIDGFHTFDHALVDFFYVNRMLTVGGIVLLDDIQCPSIQRVAAFINTLPAYRPLALPEAFEHQRTVRVRRLLKVPPVRIVGFHKAQPDERKWDWYQEF